MSAAHEAPGTRSGERGHRHLPHTADVQVEAWAPNREECLVEAVRGLVATCVDVAGAAPTGTWDVHADGHDTGVLLAVLDEVIYLLDTTGRVPVETSVTVVADGVDVQFGTAEVATLPRVGAVPKAVSLHDLHVGPTDGGWACRVTVDV